MEVSPQELIEQYYEIQEVKEIPRSESITRDPSAGIIEKATYLSRCDLPSNSMSTGHVREEILDDEMEVILLLQEEEPARHHQAETTADRRVIELSDNNSKLTLRRQLEMTNTIEQVDATLLRDDEDTKILRKLPSSTIVQTRKETRSSKVEDSDYKELTETNSSSSGGGSSSTSDCAAAKVKRIPRAVRNKTRETVEVRRNPMRVSKKDVDKDFPRPRQRLLANRREVCENYEVGKRTRSSATPYMNTRSVTRKMYTVGATYQAPTKRDETEWKEWPVHGMHERPVYHPQVGLAMEYLGKSFVSLDGLSYCEIVNESEIEVVAVDPRYDRRPFSAEKKSTGKAKTKSKRSSNTKDTWNTSFSKANKSFGTCMHGSLHCVLGYCSQIMTPSYKQLAEKKPITPTTKMNISESTKKNTTSFKDNIMENSDKFVEGTTLLEGYAIAMAQSVQNKNNRGRAGAGTVASSSATYASPESQRSIFENSRTNLPALRNFPNASLVLLRNSGAKTSGEVFKAKDTKDTFKLEDTFVKEETLSIYKKLMSADEVAANREASPARNSFYTLKRQSTSDLRQYKPKRNALDAQLENTRTVRVTKKSDKSGNADNAKIQQPDGVFSGPSVKNRSWCTSETSEIAKILSEYNRGVTTKSTMQIYSGASKSAKPSLAISSAKHSTKASCFWQKDTITGENQNVSGDRSVSFDLSQGKWRKPSMLENTKLENDQTQIVDNDRSASNRPGGPSTSSKSYQPTFSKDRQVNPSVSSYTREKPFVARKDIDKQRETLVIDTKPKGAVSRRSKDEEDILETEDNLQELLENTAVLYCAANGIHQDDLSSYINTLDRKQSIQWLEALLG